MRVKRQPEREREHPRVRKEHKHGGGHTGGTTLLWSGRAFNPGSPKAVKALQCPTQWVWPSVHVTLTWLDNQLDFGEIAPEDLHHGLVVQLESCRAVDVQDAVADAAPVRKVRAKVRAVGGQGHATGGAKNGRRTHRC